MYTFRLKPKLLNIEKLMDDLIEYPLVIIKDDKLARKLGIYAKPLKDEKILHISHDGKLDETVAFLKCNNYRVPNSVQKKKGKRIEYIFDSMLFPPMDFKI
jgi:hypothetical protein